MSHARRSPRIVLVLPTYLPESFGGAEQQSRKLALALGRLGMQVTVLAPRLLSQTASAEVDDTITLRRFRVRRAPNLGGRHLGSFLAWTFKLTCWLLWNRSRYEVIHIIHGRLHAVPAVVAGRLLGKPTLIKLGRGGEDHFDLDLVRRKRWVGRWYARLLIRNTTAYIANSQEIAADLRRWGVADAQIHRIPNGVDVPPPAPPGTQTRVLRFVYLGRLDPEKSLDLMLRGFARAKAAGRASLTLVGDGEDRATLERLAGELGLRETVTFSGVVRDVSQALRAADVFVSTSVSEGMSNALLEAMSFGLPPLVSRVSGVRDMVDDDRSGLLFEPNDVDAFARRLEDVLALTQSRRQAIGRQARETIEQRFGIDRVAARHVEVYRKLVAGAQGTG
jgi:glycosyltransferase involved in cell wall biosynthesis